MFWLMSDNDNKRVVDIVEDGEEMMIYIKRRVESIDKVFKFTVGNKEVTQVLCDDYDWSVYFWEE